MVQFRPPNRATDVLGEDREPEVAACDLRTCPWPEALVLGVPVVDPVRPQRWSTTTNAGSVW